MRRQTGETARGHAEESQGRPIAETQVRLPISDAAEAYVLEGTLALPDEASGVVLFAHGSGSSRHSPRNRYVAGSLQQAGLGTLLMDLLTREEEEVDRLTRHLRFDIDLLASRLTGAVDWLAAQPRTGSLAIGLFGASTGAAGALKAAARRNDVRAVVSRGGRPDLAGNALEQVQAPTLLIVGADDLHVITLNELALSRLCGPRELVLVPGANHLLEEPGTLECAARLAREWFVRYLSQSSGGDVPHPNEEGEPPR